MTRFDDLLSRGNTSDVFAIGADAVVKVPRPDVPDRWIAIEACHAQPVHDAGVPSPMVLDVLQVDGRTTPAVVQLVRSRFTWGFAIRQHSPERICSGERRDLRVGSLKLLEDPAGVTA